VLVPAAHILLHLVALGAAVVIALARPLVRLQDKVNIAPVEAELGGMATIDLDLAIGDHLLDEHGDLLNNDSLNWVHFTHDALHAFFE